MIPRTRLASRAALLAIALAALAAAPACSHRKDDGTTIAAEAQLPPLTFKDDTPGLWLTWIDDKGGAHIAERPSDVPAEGRSFVRVAIADREEGARDRFYVADLAKKGDDGAYPTRTLPRRDWEVEIDRRREAQLAKTAPRPAAPAKGGAEGDRPSPAAPERGPVSVIIYGASWCGACHQAADYLRAKGVPYVLKDVDTTPGAAAEMHEKLARVGQRGNSIPVIDVRGQILVGFSPGAMDHALATAARL